MKACVRPVYKEIEGNKTPVSCEKCYACKLNYCEFCGSGYSDNEVFELLNIDSIPEHFYCSEYCYKKDENEI